MALMRFSLFSSAEAAESSEFLVRTWMWSRSQKWGSPSAHQMLFLPEGGGGATSGGPSGGMRSGVYWGDGGGSSRRPAAPRGRSVTSNRWGTWRWFPSRPSAPITHLCRRLQYESLCTVNSSSLILCPTPAVGPEAQGARVKVHFLLDSLHFDFSAVANEAFSYEPDPKLYPLNQNDKSKPYHYKPGSIISVEVSLKNLSVLCGSQESDGVLLSGRVPGSGHVQARGGGSDWRRPVFGEDSDPQPLVLRTSRSSAQQEAGRHGQPAGVHCELERRRITLQSVSAEGLMKKCDCVSGLDGKPELLAGQSAVRHPGSVHVSSGGAGGSRGGSVHPGSDCPHHCPHIQVSNPIF